MVNSQAGGGESRSAGDPRSDNRRSDYPESDYPESVRGDDPNAIATGVWTIVVGGGSGRRFGGAKQFEPVTPDARERIIDRSVRIAASVCSGVVVVVPPDLVDDERDRYANTTGKAGTSGGPDADAGERIVVVGGGDSRSASVRCGLAAVPVTAHIVCVHDAARPCATAALYERVIAAVRSGAAAAVPGLAVVDTIKVVDADGWVTATPDRAALVAVQTPQAFDAAALRRAHLDEGEGSDDALLVEAIGGRVRVVEGERVNIKVTHPDDLERLADMLSDGDRPQ